MIMVVLCLVCIAKVSLIYTQVSLIYNLPNLPCRLRDEFALLARIASVMSADRRGQNHVRANATASCLGNTMYKLSKKIKTDTNFSTEYDNDNNNQKMTVRITILVCQLPGCTDRFKMKPGNLLRQIACTSLP